MAISPLRPEDSGGRSRRAHAVSSSADVSDLAREVSGLMTREKFATEVMRTAIVTGRWRPGLRLAQDVIAEQLGISRMPVRSGLRQLESEGLVEFHPYRGAAVRLLSSREIAEIYELRILLESRLLEAAVIHLSAERVDELTTVALNIRLHSEGDDRWVDERNIFYDDLYRLADLPRISRLVASLRREVGPYLALRPRTPHHTHIGVLEHLATGDVVSAKSVLRAHLLRVSGELQGLVERLAES